jgi:hypothetical protein
MTAAPGCAFTVSPGAVWFNKRQLINGSCTNASSIAMTLSLFERNTPMTPSHVLRKFPSMPLTSMARTNMRVSLKGTRSGNFSRCIEAVPEIDVQYLAGVSVQHQVTRVPVAQPEEVANHGHHRQRTCVGRSPVEPRLGGARLEPKDAREVVARGVLQRVLEHLNLN